MFDGDLEEKLEMVKLFITDSRELLDDVEPKIIEMEEKALAAGEIDKDILNAIFRLFHSLKGSASFLDLQTIISVTHEAETLLDIFRNRKAAVNPEHVDLLIRTSDFIRNILDTVERQLSDEGYEGEAEGIVSDLKKTISHVEEETGAPAGMEKIPDGGRPAGASGQAPPAGRQASGMCGPAPAAESRPDSGCGRDGDHSGNDPGDPGQAGAGGAYTPSASLAEMDLAITPEMAGRFVEEGRELLDDAENAVLALEKRPQDREYANLAFRALHSFKGNAGFFGYAELEDLSHHTETLLNKMREDEKAGEPVAISFLLIAIDALRDGVGQVGAGMGIDLPGKKEICRHLKELAAAAEDDNGEDRGDTRREDTGGIGFDIQNAADHPRQSSKQRPEPNSPDGPLEMDGKTAQQPAGEPEERESSAAKQQQAIRVDLDKLDTD